MAGLLPPRDQYPNLPHPPFVITGLGHLWGGDWLPLTVHGYIAGKRVATRRISNDGIPRKLILRADDATIFADGADMTRISMRITDEFDNILPFAMQPVILELAGPAALVGDNPFPMPGGRGTVYIRATQKPGIIKVIARTPRLPPASVTIRSVIESPPRLLEPGKFARGTAT